MNDDPTLAPMTIERAQGILAGARERIKRAIESAMSEINDAGLVVAGIDIDYKTISEQGKQPFVIVDRVDIKAYISPARTTALTDRG